MPDLKLDPATMDVQLVNGDLALTNEESGEATAQRLRIRLRLFKGEWFLDTRLGIPYHEEVLKKDPDMGRIEALLKVCILETKGVIKLSAYTQTLDRATRKLTVDFRVETATGIELRLKEVI